MIHTCDKPCGNKTASGYCATTACINPQYSNIGTAHYGQGVQKRIVTNSDRIRSMTDEELAEMLNHAQGDGFLIGIGQRKMSAYGNWLEWLRQEATE